MSEPFEPRAGMFVARYRRYWNSDVLINHVLVERVTPQTALAGGVRYRRPKPRPNADLTRWSDGRGWAACAIGPALEPQEKLRAEHEARLESARLWVVRRQIERALESADMAQLREVAQLLGVEVSDG